MTICRRWLLVCGVAFLCAAARLAAQPKGGASKGPTAPAAEATGKALRSQEADSKARAEIAKMGAELGAAFRAREAAFEREHQQRLSRMEQALLALKPAGGASAIALQAPSGIGGVGGPDVNDDPSRPHGPRPTPRTPTPPPTPTPYGALHLTKIADGDAKAEGEQGMIVLLSGDGFKPGADVEFMWGGIGVSSPQVTYWNSNLMLAHVPTFQTWVTAPTITSVWVRQGGVKSNSLAFNVLPTLELKQLRCPNFNAEAQIAAPAHEFGCLLHYQGCSDNLWFVWHTVGVFLGDKGDDVFFPSYHLKNGWLVDSIDFRGTHKSGADTSVTESYPGTNSPHLKVHWWEDASTVGGWEADYAVLILIKGPKGVPYE